LSELLSLLLVLLSLLLDELSSELLELTGRRLRFFTAAWAAAAGLAVRPI
jgi:hypothetical protein